MSNSTGGSLSFVEVSGAAATVLGIIAALAALLAVVFHKNASCCARCLSILCCRARSNRIESFHVRRVAADVAAISGNHIASISAHSSFEKPSDEPTYVEPDIIPHSLPTREPAELPVFAALTASERIALENADPPLSGRGKKIGKSDSFKL